MPENTSILLALPDSKPVYLLYQWAWLKVANLKRTCSQVSNQHWFMSSLKPSGQDDGIGKWRLLLPTPQMTADESTFLYGTSWVISSQSTTPYDLSMSKDNSKSLCTFKNQCITMFLSRNIWDATKVSHNITLHTFFYTFCNWIK